MTEEQIHQYISTIVAEQIEELKKSLLLEMPYPRNVYKEKVDALLPQLLTNWCLVRYRTITNTEPYKKHWQGKTYGIESFHKIVRKILIFLKENTIYII